MSLTHLDIWLRTMPRFDGSPDADVSTLCQRAAEGEGLVRGLSDLVTTASEQNSYKSRIRRSLRELRRRFLDKHAEWLYDALTRDRTMYLGLRDLAFGAAERWPGLLPTSTQIDEECTKRQTDKEGHEIDQGIFFGALLGSPVSGKHLAHSLLRPTARAEQLLAHFQDTSEIDLGSVTIQRRNNAAYLTINNAYCLNAEDNRLVEDMETAVDLALLHNDVRVGVLRGGFMTHIRYRGKRVFSAGINLKALHAGQISFVDFLLRRELGYLNKMRRGLLHEPNHVAALVPYRQETLPVKPWIAAVDGFAIGGGAQLLFACDRVIAASDSYISLPAAQEGIVPGFGNLRITHYLGARKARQMILCGRRIFASEPDALLLVDEVVEPEAMDQAIERNIAPMCSPAIVANRIMLNLAEEPLELFLRYAAEFSVIQSERLYDDDVLCQANAFADPRSTR